MRWIEKDGRLNKGINALVARRIFVATISVAFLLFGAAAPSYAENDDLDISRLLETRSPIKEARVAFVSAEPTFRTRLTESGLWAIGCSYHSREKTKLDALLDILSHGEIRRSTADERRFETRNAVVLALEDESEIKLLLGREYSNAGSIRGELILSRPAEIQAVAASASILPHLYEWAARAEAVTDRADGNENERNGCRSLLKPFR